MPPCEVERCHAIGVRENLSVQARYRPRCLLNFSGDGQDRRGSKLSSAHRIETIADGAIGIERCARRTSRQDRLGVPRARSAERGAGPDGRLKELVQNRRSRASCPASPACCGCRRQSRSGGCRPTCTPVNVRYRRGLGQGTRADPVRGAFRGVSSSGLVFCKASDWRDHVREGPVASRARPRFWRVPWHCRPPTVLWLPGAIERLRWVENRPRPGREAEGAAPARRRAGPRPAIVSMYTIASSAL